MPQICHAHCPKEGGGWVALAAVILVVAFVAGAVHRAAHEIEHVALEVVTIGAICLGSALVLAVAGYAAVKLSRSQEFRDALADPVARERARIAQAKVRAIDPPKRNLAAEHGAYTITGLAGIRREEDPWNG